MRKIEINLFSDLQRDGDILRICFYQNWLDVPSFLFRVGPYSKRYILTKFARATGVSLRLCV